MPGQRRGRGGTSDMSWAVANYERSNTQQLKATHFDWAARHPGYGPGAQEAMNVRFEREMVERGLKRERAVATAAAAAAAAPKTPCTSSQAHIVDKELIKLPDAGRYASETGVGSQHTTPNLVGTSRTSASGSSRSLIKTRSVVASSTTVTKEKADPLKKVAVGKVVKKTQTRKAPMTAGTKRLWKVLGIK
ncbi:hypothetical protein P154DRAFT_522695 [Amniculicola lignicola CBS 123094]|uniref:Uncharacterized protein n=1 Tax=Amniculicola lignicola CBS 123094 TaxID=1392246 RepID=A0A6A5WGJ8_9PLEO|nr:hypothetical protein P154DRAFT_522695 [Amniculicola lignicola CBS 123094]